MEKKGFIIRHKEKILALVFFVALACAFTYPLVRKLDHVIEFPDTYFFFWVFWWVKKAIVGLQQNPFVTDYMCQPTGAKLYFTTLTLGNSIPAMVLQAVFSVTESYNIVVLSSFVLAGFGVFLLSRYLGGGRLPSVLAGVIYAFSPFHFNQVRHGFLNISSIQWIPFYLLYLIKTIREDDKRNPFIAAFFLVLTALSAWEHAYYALILSSLVIPLEFYFGGRKRIFRSTKRVLIAAVLSVLLISPIAYPMMREAGTQKYMRKGIEDQAFRSADLLSFVTPDFANPKFAGKTGPTIHRFLGNPYNKITFLGYVVIAVMMLAVISRPNTRTLFWLGAAILFVLLALGPVLHVNGRVIKYAEVKEITLPYSVLWKHLPFFNISRFPSRMVNIAQLCLALFIGTAVKWLPFYESETLRRRLLSLFVFALLLYMIHYEYNVPFHLTKYPEFNDLGVYEEMKNDAGEYVVLDLPLNYMEQGGLFRATKHERKTIDCIVSRYSPEIASRMKEHRNAIKILQKPSWFWDESGESEKKIRNLIEENNIGYIIVTHRGYTEDDMSSLDNIIKKTGGRLREENKDVYVYDMRKK